MKQDNSQIMRNKDTLYWLRWILVLPAAIGAYFGIQFAVAIANSIGLGPEWFVNIYCQIINSIIGPYCLIMAGAKTAPDYHFIVAVVLTAIHLVAAGYIVTYAIISNNHVDPLWWLTLSMVFGITATIVACIQCHKNERK